MPRNIYTQQLDCATLKMDSVKPQTPHGSAYRQYLPDLSIPRFTTMRQQNAREYADAFKKSGQPPWLHGLYLHWRELYEESFHGITNDGATFYLSLFNLTLTNVPGVARDVFRLRDEGIPIDIITNAANAVLEGLTEEQRTKTLYHVDSPEWRTWSNPEFLLSDKGIRLDDEDVTPELRTKIMQVLRTTLSPEGYEKAVGAMRVNNFLGELVQSPLVMNEFSYSFVLFGEPSTSRPWGFSFYGHHLCLNIFLYKGQIVVSPWFTGAEPNIIDEGPYKGTRILENEETLGLRLMQSLPEDLKAKSQVYKFMKDPEMPQGRWNHDDQRHLCGAYRDNRVIPYEGILVSEMTTAQQNTILAICKEYLLYLPEKARQIRLDEIQGWFHETYWCWIGGYGDDDPFYYRIQSPVVIVEFDHHSGVFLTNGEPAKFHIHTLLRTPNRGDYGMALRPLIPRVEQGFVWEG